MRQVAAGRRVVTPELADAAWGAGNPLIERERAVLRLAEEGRSNNDFANTLGPAHGTTRNCLHEATQKLGAKTAWKPRASPAPTAGCRALEQAALTADIAFVGTGPH